ncbi:MAG: RnfABCDGE type electron transport complex subunit G [Termitinemataceae bacterium]|nr:MAG: RnfABCDGE type electron transport complex subunit G [Termitinemataceae bacterium]
MKDTIKMVAAIVIFAVVACSGLAIVYEKTAPAIAKNNEKILNDALSSLFPLLNEGANATKIQDSLSNSFDGVTLGDTYKIEQNGQILGLAITSSSFGFQADIKALVGVGTDGRIVGVKIMENTDTPGLGANAGKETYYVDKPNKITFYGQYAGKDASSELKVAKDGGDIVAITASTISSRAVTKLVTAAAQSGSSWLQNAQGGAN